MAGSSDQRISNGGSDVAGTLVKEEQLNNNSGTLDSDCNGAADDRRLLRSRYLALKTLIQVSDCKLSIDADKKHGILSSEDLNDFNSLIKKADNLHQLVQKPREQVADAEALLDISNSLVTSVKSQANEGLTPSDFIARVLMEYRAASGTEQISLRWHDLGRTVGNVFRHCRGCSTMLGPMTNELKQRKVAAQRQRSKPAETSRPEALYEKGEEEQTDTDKNMLTMFGILRRRKRVRLEVLILNRQSFAQTVENLFAISFLVKDGRVEILVDEDGSHYVLPKNAPSACLVTSGDVRYDHFIFRLDFKDWKLMTDTVAVGAELMPDRICSTSTNEQCIPHNASQASCGTSHVQDSSILDATVHEDLVVEDSPERDTDTQPRRLRASGFRHLKRK